MDNEKEQAMKDYIAKESLLEESKQQYFLMGAVAYYLSPINEAVGTVFTFLSWIRPFDHSVDHTLDNLPLYSWGEKGLVRVVDDENFEVDDDDEASDSDDLDDEDYDDDRDVMGPLEDVGPFTRMDDLIQAVEELLQERRGQPEAPQPQPRMEFPKPIFGIYNPKKF